MKNGKLHWKFIGSCFRMTGKHGFIDMLWRTVTSSWVFFFTSGDDGDSRGNSGYKLTFEWELHSNNTHRHYDSNLIVWNTISKFSFINNESIKKPSVTLIFNYVLFNTNHC